MSDFWGKLSYQADRCGTLLCLGLDPEEDKLLMAGYSSGEEGLFAYCRDVIEAVSDTVVAVKLQCAHFSAIGAQAVLKSVCEHVKKYYPDLPLILDAKRGDISTTSKFYALEVFKYYNADAVTVNGYLGPDSVTPFVEYDNSSRGVFVLCRTSNPGAAVIQEQLLKNGQTLAQHLAALYFQSFGSSVGLVIGATQPDYLSYIRSHYPDTWMLLPGFGAQGGSLEEIMSLLSANSLSSYSEARILCSYSRSLLYGSGEPSIAAVRHRALSLTHKIQELFSRNTFN